MKTVLNLLNNNVMKNAVKYICVLLLLVGVNVSVLGAASINGSISSKLIEVDDDHAEGYFTFTFSSTNVEADPGKSKYLNVYLDNYTDNDTYWLSCGFGTTSEEVGEGYFQSTSTSGTIGFYYNITEEGDYSTTLTIWGYENDSYTYIGYDVPITISVHKSCTERTLTFANATITKDFGTAASKFQDYTLSAGSGTITWSSDDPSIASVNSSGVVTIHKAGSTYINVAVAADGTYCAEEDFYEIIVNALTPVVSSTETGKELTVSGITSTGATFSGGVVTSKGNATITRYGFVIGTSATVVVSGEGINAPVAGSYWSEDIALNTAFGSKTATTSFSPNTTYYVRAFAYNGSIYGYSTAVPFTTLAEYDIELAKNNSEAGSEDGLATVVQNATSLKEILHATNTNTTGYHLDGYYTNDATPVKVLDADGSFAATDVTGYITDGHWSGTSDITLYAHWALNTYTISFNANGGSGSMDGVEKDYGSTYALPACGFTAPSGKVFDGWAEGSAGGTKRTLPYDHTVTGNITFYALWRDATYTNYVFSCAELTLTGPTGDLVFITSAASKTVRSQEAFHVTGSGLTPSTTLTFAMSDPTIADKFAFKQADGSAVATDASGAINMDFYVFYTPASGDTEDGLDIFTNLSASISGTKPKASAALTDKTIIGRHLPTDFVIAAKNTTTNKWFALPANMSGTGNPVPAEIAVDDIDNPTIAYTANSNIYNLYTNGTPYYVQLGMKNNVDGSSKSYALWANNSASGTNIGKNTGLAESNLGANYQWLLTQTNTGITNPQDAKYTISNPNNSNALKLWLAAGGAGNPQWGLYASGVSELRLIPASSVVFTEAEIVAWGHHNAIVEVDKANAGGTGVAAAKVKAKLNGEESSLITLTETKTSNGTGATKYDYTVAFGDVIDFAANEGQMLTLEWYNSSDVMIAVSNIMVPTIVASNITINKTNYSLKSAWNTEVHVLPNVTVTVDASAYDNSDVTIKELNIYPGATVNVTTGTLKATTLVMRNGWNRLNGDKKYDVARLYITPTNGNLQATNAYADWYIDFDQYYPIAVPWEVDLSVNDGSKIWYRNTKSKAVIGTTTGSVRLRYYDGASRAANVQVGVGESANWKLYGDDGCNPIPVKLEPGKAYAMTAKRPAGKAFSIIRMPLTIPSAAWTTEGEKGVMGSTHKDQVTVSAYGDASTPSYAKGWNFIANPYMSLHKGALSYTDEGAIEYANIPDIDFQEYDQVPIVSTKLKPASGFLIQAPKNGTVTFGAVNRQASAPSYRKEVADETMPIQRAYITLAGDGAEDMMGILVGENYTAEYETNADLAKLLSNSNTLRTYMYYGEQNMAYLAISPVLAQKWIPVQVRIPAEGEYTFSLDNASVVDNLEGVYLIDYANNDQITNLIEENYTFTTSAGTINGRFAINAVVGTRQTPTAIDVIGEGNKGNGPVKFIYHENVYIWHNGIIYDATGKKVK